MTQRTFSRGGDPVTEADATSGNETVTLSHGFTPGRTWTVERIDGSAYTVTVSAESGDTLNGTANGSITVPAREAVVLDRIDAGWRTRGFGDEEGAGVTPISSYTYNADGTVATETVAGVTTTYTYNSDASVATSTRAGVTRTFTYNSDGTIASVA